MHVLVPIFRLNGENSDEISVGKTLLLWMEYDLVPGGRDYEDKWFTNNKEIKETFNLLKAQYKENERPIIVLHSDHGTCLTTISPLLFDSRKLLPQQLDAEQEQLYGNLLTIYCPSSWGPEKVPLSLVNLYRFVFNHLLGKNYEYLENYCCIKN